MKKRYKHLSSEERDKIAILRAEGKSRNEIARMIGRDKGTVSRELRRNGSRIYDVYLPHKAQERSDKRNQQTHRRRRLKDALIRRYVIGKLKIGWSPEYIAGRIPIDYPGYRISHETIYQYIYAPEVREGINLVPYLARAYKRRLRRGYSRKHTKTHIPSRISIEKRPKYIGKRKQYGHWEVDTVVSRSSPSALVVAAERVSRLTKITRIDRKESSQLRKAVNRRLSHCPQHLRRTITYDNGSENVQHQRLNVELGTKSYFCNPYHSWEKGTVENIIGLIRRFLPKKTDFATIPIKYIKKIERMLNNRPKKCLNFRTPLEIFNKGVALNC